jgi:carboxymethylenebutenolidase
LALPGEVADPDSVIVRRVRIGPKDDEFSAYVASPKRDDGTSRPGVVVIHEAFGLVPHIEDVARRFANIGFDAVAPDLYSRVSTPDPSDVAAVLRHMFELGDAQVVRDLELCASLLRSLPGSNQKVGSIGFCAGGRQSLIFACSSAAADAAVDCWGGFVDRATPDQVSTPSRPLPVIDIVRQARCPLLLVGGAEDDNPSPDVLAELGRRLEGAGKDAKVKIFADAGHAFFADYRPTFREARAHELWSDVVGFFGEKLS